MINNPLFFLGLIFVIGVVAKNSPLIIASAVLFGLKLIGTNEKVFEVVQSKGINIGITIITIAVLVPIATGEITIKDMLETVKTPSAWIAIISGVIVAILARNGIDLLASDPQMTVALVFGSLIAIAFFNGVAVGPLIGAGIAYSIMNIFERFTN